MKPRGEQVLSAVMMPRDTNVYGQARGGAFPRTVWFRNEIRVPLPFLKLTIDLLSLNFLP